MPTDGQPINIRAKGAQLEWLRRLRAYITDQEFDVIARVLGISPQDDKVREEIGMSFYMALHPRHPRRQQFPSPKEEKALLAAAQKAGSELHRALCRLINSPGAALMLLEMTINPPTTVDDVLAEEPTSGHGVDATQDNRITLRQLVRGCESLRSGTEETIKQNYTDLRDLRGRPVDWQRDEVARKAADLYETYRGRRATLTTHHSRKDKNKDNQSPKYTETTYGGDFFDLASTIDSAFLRAAGLDPKREPSIGSILKRLIREWACQPEVDIFILEMMLFMEGISSDEELKRVLTFEKQRFDDILRRAAAKSREAY